MKTLFKFLDNKISIKSNKGFTIIEVLIAVSILVVAFTGMYGLMTSNIKGNTSLNQFRIANQLTADLMTRKVRNEDFDLLYTKLQTASDKTQGFSLIDQNITKSGWSTLLSEFPELDKFKYNSPEINIKLFPVKDTASVDTYSANMISANVEVKWKKGKDYSRNNISTIITKNGTNSNKETFNSAFILPESTPSPMISSGTGGIGGSGTTPTPTPTPKGTKKKYEACTAGTGGGECESGICRLQTPPGKWRGLWCN